MRVWATDMTGEVPTGWAEAMAAMVDEQAALLAAGRWTRGPADLLSVVGVDRAEAVHSAAVAWLLDPRMRHGLGSEFLSRMLRRCFPGDTFTRPEGARCEREVLRGAVRADIVVRGDEWTVVIENKIDAGESDGQCDAYHDLFCEERGAHYVFLTPSGRSPATATGEAAEAFRPLGYRAVLEDLQGALAATRADPDTPGRRAAVAYVDALEAWLR